MLETNRPVTTLFMIESLDGKISTGSTDNMDIDKDFPLIAGIKEGLHQYYEAEQDTDLWSLNSGRTLAKIGINTREFEAEQSIVSFLVIDNTHLTEHGVKYLSSKLKNLVIITTNQNHPAFNVREENVELVCQPELNIGEALQFIKNEYGCERITVQTGSTLNSEMLRDNLIDYVDIIIAPALIGGKDTPSLIGGLNLTASSQLDLIKTLKLQDCKVLQDSYIRVTYSVE